MTKEARIRCNECSKALHVSELNQGFTVGRQYRETWLDSRGAAPMGNKILFLYNYGCLRMYVQGCLKMYVHETITWANEQFRPTHLFKYDLDKRDMTGHLELCRNEEAPLKQVRACQKTSMLSQAEITVIIYITWITGCTQETNE